MIFHGKERKINIPQHVGARYTIFGVALLEDDYGERVENIVGKHRPNAEEINNEIIREWIAGRGKKPVTWNTFIKVLREIDLTNLADEIEAVKC